MAVLGMTELICGRFQTLAIEFVDALNVDILRVVNEKLPSRRMPLPGAANTGAAAATVIVPPMLSPPLLTGVTPASSSILCTCLGSM